MGKRVASILQGRISGARWAAGQCSQSSRAEPPATDAKGDEHGVEQHSGVWSWAVSAVVRSLPQLHLDSGAFHPSGSFDKCLGSPDGKCGISQEPVYGWSRSADTAVLVTCASILGVTPCQIHMCRYLRCNSLPNVLTVTQVIFLLNQSVMADWQPF